MDAGTKQFLKRGQSGGGKGEKGKDGQPVGAEKGKGSKGKGKAGKGPWFSFRDTGRCNQGKYCPYDHITLQRLLEECGLLDNLRQRECPNCKASGREKVHLLLLLLKAGIRKTAKEKEISKAKATARAKVKEKVKVKEKEKEKARVSMEREAHRNLLRSRSFAGTSNKAGLALTAERNALGCAAKRSSIKTEITSETRRRKRMSKELSMAVGVIQPAGHAKILGMKD